MVPLLSIHGHPLISDFIWSPTVRLSDRGGTYFIVHELLRATLIYEIFDKFKFSLSLNCLDFTWILRKFVEHLK